MKQTIDLFEITARDGDKTKNFYESLLNWKISDVGPMMKISSVDAGMKGHILKWPSERPSHLTIYIRVVNISECLEKVVQLGGKVILEEMSVPSGGSIAKFMDLDGNVAAIFQNDAQEERSIVENIKVNQIGFFEIASKEGHRSKEFYETIFNWKISDKGPEMNISGEDAGIKGNILNWSHEEPTFLTIYVKVENISASLEKVSKLGGTVHISETKIRNGGTFAQFKDLDGNIIGLYSGR